MTTEPPGSLVTEEVHSLEVRWIFPGQLETSVVGWFARPFSPLSQDSADPAGWRPVLKGRRISHFSPSSGEIAARGPRLINELRCEVELTEVRTRGRLWRTLGFEATGPADLLRSELDATAAVVFSHALPGGMEPGPDESRSYAEWLGQMPDRENDGDA